MFNNGIYSKDWGGFDVGSWEAVTSLSCPALSPSLPTRQDGHLREGSPCLVFIMPPELDAASPILWTGKRWDGVACDVSPAPVEGGLVAGG